MKYVTHFFTILLAFVLIGCDSASEGNYNLGEQVYYKDFWFSKFVPDTLSKTLNVDFTEASRPIKLQLYKKIEGGREVAVKTSEAQLFLNSKECQSNIITLKPSKHKARLGLVFSSQAPKGEHTWYVKVIDWGGLEQINSGTDDTLFVWHAAKIVRMNPVKRNLIFAGVGLVLLLLLWLLISRVLIWPSTKFSTLYMDYCDGYGQKSIRMTGKYELVCTNNAKMKDSALRVFFVGKRQFEYNDFWTEPVTIKTGARANSVRIIKTHNFNLSGDLKRKEVIEIINADGKSVKIETT